MSADRLVFRGLVALLAAVCAAGLVRIAATIFLHVPLDPNEGWNAYHSLAAMSGGALYPPPDSFMFNNYPPLSFWIVGAFGQAIGDNIFAGRILSLAATLCIAGSVFVTLRFMDVGRWRALFAALLLVAGLLDFTDYVGMDDPQLLGQAVAMGGLVLLVRRPRTPAVIAIASMLMTAALFVKHNLVALPAATVLWLALHDRHAAMRFAISGIAFALAGLALFHMVYGVSLIGQLNSARLWSGEVFAANLANFLIWSNVSLFGLAILAFFGKGDRHIALCAIYAAMSGAVGVPFAGGAGVDMNIWFDAAIALALGGGLLLQKLSGRSWLGTAVAFAYAIPLLAGLWLNWNGDWLTGDFWLYPLAEETASAEADIAFLKGHDGPALCEMLSLCYWAGKREEVDVFNLGQAFATGRQSDAALVRLIDARRFRTLEFDSLDDFTLGPNVRRAAMRQYRVDHASENGAFLVAR